MATPGTSSAWGPFEGRLVEAQMLAAPTLGPRGIVCSAYDDTVCSDVGGFYRSPKTHLWQVGMVASLSPSFGLRLRLTEGVSAPKATLRPRLLTGWILHRPMGGQRTLMAEIYTSWGGDLVHRPCIDAYDRQYYCAHLTAWEDFPAKRIKPQDYGFRIAYRF